MTTNDPRFRVFCNLSSIYDQLNNAGALLDPEIDKAALSPLTYAIANTAASIKVLANQIFEPQPVENNG